MEWRKVKWYIWGCHIVKRAGVRARVCQSGSRRWVLACGTLLPRALSGVPGPSVSPGPGTITSLTSTIPHPAVGCFGCLLYFWLLSPGQQSMYMIALHTGCKSTALTSPFHHLILPLPGYSYFLNLIPQGPRWMGPPEGHEVWPLPKEEGVGVCDLWKYSSHHHCLTLDSGII